MSELSLDPGEIAKFVGERSVFFFRDHETDFPSADEYSFMGDAQSRRMKAACFGYCRYKDYTIRAYAAHTSNADTEAEKQVLTQRCGVQLMNAVAKEIMKEQSERRVVSVETKPEIIVP